MKRAKVVTELSCYMDNEPGMLAKIAEKMAEKGVNVIGIQSYDGQLQSLVRLIVDKTDAAEQVMRNLGVDLISRPEIMEILVRNEVGGLAEVTALLGKHDININSIYSTDGVNEKVGRAFIRVSDPEKARDLLNGHLPDIEG